MSEVIDTNDMILARNRLNDAFHFFMQHIGEHLEAEARRNCGNKVLNFWDPLTAFTIGLKGSSSMLRQTGFLANAIEHRIQNIEGSHLDLNLRVGIFRDINNEDLVRYAHIHELGGHLPNVVERPTLPFVIPFRGRERMRKWFFARLKELKDRGLISNQTYVRSTNRPGEPAIVIPPRPFLAPTYDEIVNGIPRIMSQILNNALANVDVTQRI